MSKFPYVSITPVAGSDRFYQLSESVTFIFDDCIITLPAGLQADGATIPRFLWTLLGTHPLSTTIVTGAFVHDLTYTPLVTTERRSNEMMYEICKDHGMSKFKLLIVKYGLALLVKPWYYWFGRNSVRALRKLNSEDLYKRTLFVDSMITRTNLETFKL